MSESMYPKTSTLLNLTAFARKDPIVYSCHLQADIVQDIEKAIFALESEIDSIACGVFALDEEFALLEIMSDRDQLLSALYFYEQGNGVVH